MLKYEKEMEKKKFGSMSNHDKFQHILEYYKWHIIIGVASLIFIYSLLNMYIFNPAPKSSLEVAVIGNYVSHEVTGQLEEELRQQFPELREDNHEIRIIPVGFGQGDADPMTMMANTQKLVAMVSAKELDIIVGSKELMLGYAGQGFFADLSKRLVGEEFDKIKDNVIETKVIIESEQDKEPHPYLVDISGFKSLNDGIDGEDLYMGVLVNTTREDATKAVFDYFYQHK